MPNTHEYSTGHMLRDMLQHIRRYRLRFSIGTVLSIFAQSIWLVFPWILGEIITFASNYEQGDATTLVWQYLGIIIAVVILFYSGQEIARYLIYLVAEKSAVNLQLRTLRHLTSLDMVWHEREHIGNKLKKIGRGGRSLNTMMRLFVDMGIEGVVTIIGVSAIFYVLSWELCVVMLFFFVTHYFLARYLTRRAMDQSKKVNAEEEDFSGIKFEILNGIATVKTLDIADPLMKWIDAITERLIEAIRKRIILFRSRLAFLNFYHQFFRIGTVGYAIWQVLEGNFEVGMIAQVYFYFGKVDLAAQRFSAIYHRFIIAKIDLMGVHGILSESPEVETAGSKEFPEDWQTLRLKAVSFSYGDNQVLNQLELDIKRGEKIGIVGASGEGKSTLFKLLLKLYDHYEGFIGLDDVSLREIKREQYAQHIGVVLQDTELFDLSIRDNITLGAERNAANDKRLDQAVRIARLDELTSQREIGLDSLVGEKGIKLSGGEKQRLGIARAIFRHPDILFLDEATSHLDGDSERKIQEALHIFFQGITAIVIAHRLSTLQDMDRIVVLKNGKFVEEGRFEELMERESLFREMWEQQQIA